MGLGMGKRPRPPKSRLGMVLSYWIWPQLWPRRVYAFAAGAGLLIGAIPETSRHLKNQTSSQHPLVKRPAASVHITGAATGQNRLIIAPIMRPCLFCTVHSLMQLTLLVGSVHGNARQIAQTLAFAAPEHGASAQVLDMQDLTIAVFDTPGLFVLCCSTTGSGDVPDNARGLYQSLDADARFLGHVRFGLVALGDSSYGDTFFGGAKAFQSRLQDLGAQCVGEVCVLDALAADDPDTVALAWFSTWVQQARSIAPSVFC